MHMSRVWAAAGTAVLLCCLFLCTASGLRYDSLTAEGTMELRYADQFSVVRLSDGYQEITVGEDQRFLTVPQGAPIPEGIPADMAVLQLPLQNIYLVSSSSMDYFRALDAVDSIRLSGQKADGWYLPEARSAMESGKMHYAGKYSAPDYEMILSFGCDAAIENTMIYHTPEVKEQLERLGIPVIVDRSGYETEPLGRMEWIRFYGALLGREEEAERYYTEVLDSLREVLQTASLDKTVSFFFVTSGGTVNVRRSGDYVAKAIALAGGTHISFDADEEESAMSTQSITMESYYAGARQADLLIYNSTIDGEIDSMEELLQRCPLLADFTAVRQGNVWCLGKNFYQEPLSLGRLILDVNAVLSDRIDAELYFLKKIS